MEKKEFYGDRPLPKSIRWARSLSDRDIVTILNAALFKAAARHPKEYVELQYELVHEIKHRFSSFERVPKNTNYEDDYEDEEEEESDDR